MPSVIDIWNSALYKLGQTAVASEAEVSTTAEMCTKLWPTVRDYVLRAHPWNCCISRATLAQLSTVPLFDWAYQYQLPPDCLRVLNLENDADFKIEGRLLLTDEGTAKIKYVRREEDPQQYDMMLVECLVLRLAAELAIPVTGNRNTSELFLLRYGQALGEAKAMDGAEGTPDELYSDVLTEVR